MIRTLSRCLKRARPTVCCSLRCATCPADQYALACSVFELLTGALPFVRDQATAMIWAHMSQPPPLLTARRPDLPTAADQVLARGLAKAPTDRYPSCGEFADALRQALGLTPYHPSPGAPVTDHRPTEVAWPADRGSTPQRTSLTGPSSRGSRPDHRRSRNPRRSSEHRLCPRCRQRPSAFGEGH